MDQGGLALQIVEKPKKSHYPNAEPAFCRCELPHEIEEEDEE